MMRSATVNGVETVYAYDADQQRRTRTGANGAEYFVHGPGYVPLAEYREVNGQLTWMRDYIYAGSRLVASVAPVVPPPTYSFTNDPLVGGANGTPIRAVHLTELRAAINTARGLWSLPPIDPWPTDHAVSPHVTLIKKAHLDELRSALNAAYAAAGAPAPQYTDPTITANATPIKAAHFNELRAAVRNLAVPPDGGTSYYHLDALGSVRAVSDATGTVLRRHDYLAFGEEYQPEAGADVRRFTGKERDVETDLDYFAVRYSQTNVGRFLNVDPLLALGQHLRFTQTWNRYAYTVNNPLRYVDPSGESIRLTGETEDERKAQLEAIRKSLGNSAVANRLYMNKVGSEFYVGIAGSADGFAAAGYLESALAHVVTSSQVVDFGFATRYRMYDEDLIEKLPFMKGAGALSIVGGEVGRHQGGGISIANWLSLSGRFEVWIDPNHILDPAAAQQGIPKSTLGEVVAHELLGHSFAFMLGIRSASVHHAFAVFAENAARSRGGPNRGQKRRH